MVPAMFRGLSFIWKVLLNTVWAGGLIVLFAPAKFVLRGERRARFMLFLARIAERWVDRNDRVMDRMLTTRWDVSGIDGLRYDGHYLVISNHVSWVDIFVLFRVFHGKSSFIRFFMKHQLIYFPIVGQACDALDLPFMKRYTPE